MIVARRALLVSSGVAAVLATIVLASGGVSIRLSWIRLSAHNPLPALAIALLAGAAALTISARREISDDLQRCWRAMTPAAPWIAGAAAVATLALGIGYGTFVAAGSDAYGYISQAALWTRGTPRITHPLALAAPWPAAERTFAPLGYRPGMARGEIVPTYPPGLPLLMALLQLVAGPAAAYLVVPLLGAVAVWLTFLVGRMMGGPESGLVAAILLACSPIFLFQLVQPMSDVPAATFWLAAVVLVALPSTWAAFAAGATASMAILVRPNLAPLAALIAIGVVFGGAGSFALRSRLRALGAFACGVAPGCLALTWLNLELYGSPISPAYGSPTDIFSTANIVPNVERYSRWMYGTQMLFVFLAPAYPVLAAVGPRAWRWPELQRQSTLFAWLSLGIIVITGFSYVVYFPFENWTYLRFLLPALPLLLGLSAALAVAVIRRIPESARAPALVLLCALLGSWYARTAVDRGAFRLQAIERRYADAGVYVTGAVPERAVVLTVQHSGSVHFYSGRTTLRWDELDPAWLDRAIATLHARGHPCYVLVEDWEEPVFRARFSHASVLGALDWPPVAEISRLVRVRLYDLRDRERFIRGEPVRTRRLF